MSNNAGSIAPLLIAAAVGGALSWGTFGLMSDDSAQVEKITALESRILDLELALQEKETALEKARSWTWDIAQTQTSEPSAKATANVASGAIQSPTATTEDTPQQPVIDDQQILRQLGTISESDPRSLSEKVADLLTANPNPQTVTIVSHGLVDMAGNTEQVPDYALEDLYQNQHNPELKRVAAQVLSMRGDNRLMDKQVSDAQARLSSGSPAEKQKALVELAKTRYAGAANAIAPLLKDSDTGVKLDALLALRATGNQSHVHLAESLVNHADPAVSWLAKDVVDSLQNLSDKARTKIASADIVAELPITSSP